MNLKILIPAIALLLLAVDATGQPVPQRARMVLWYADTLLSKASTTTRPRVPLEEQAANLVRSAFRGKVDSIISIDPHFRRVIFIAQTSQLSLVRAFSWVVSLMPWPEVIVDYDDTGEKVRADNIPPRSTAAVQKNASLMARPGDSVVVGIFDISLPLINNNAFRDLRWAGTIDYPSKGRNHATHVAGIVGTVGDGSGQYRGMAPYALLRAWSIFDTDGRFNMALPPATAARMYMQTDSMHISQNSWTIRPPKDNPCNEFGTYNGFCMEYDKLVREQGLTVVFSAGNLRCTCYEALCGLGGYRTVMAPATAKNIITVGAIESDGTIATFSSYGGTADHRIVPHIVALGVDVMSSVPMSSTSNQITFTKMSGTSMAAPAVSGGLAVLVQAFRFRNGGAVPAPALLKALLLNNATDLGEPGPDMMFGYGRMDIAAASNAITHARYFSGSSTATSPLTHYNIDVASGCALKVMLCYSDSAASPGTGAGKALMNNLDLMVIAPDNTVYLPLKLDPADLTKPAKPGTIPNDNVEQVVVSEPMSGKWCIIVNGTVLKDTQDYAVTWSRACSTVTSTTIGTTGVSGQFK